MGSSSRGSGLSGRKREYAIKNSHSDFPVIWMGIFIWYVAYVNYGIKEMYCFNRQRVKSGTAWVAGIPTDHIISDIDAIIGK